MLDIIIVGIEGVISVVLLIYTVIFVSQRDNLLKNFLKIVLGNNYKKIDSYTYEGDNKIITFEPDYKKYIVFKKEN